jgi:hypothetical protein
MDPITATRGDQSIFANGVNWAGIVCQFHRGEAIIGHETRIDPDTNEPRRVEQELIDSDGNVVLDSFGKPHTELVDAEFPIYSDNLGHDPDCDACRRAVLDTRLHMAAVEADRMQADFDLREQLRARGLDPDKIMGGNA